MPTMAHFDEMLGGIEHYLKNRDFMSFLRQSALSALERASAEKLAEFAFGGLDESIEAFDAELGSPISTFTMSADEDDEEFDEDDFEDDDDEDDYDEEDLDDLEEFDPENDDDEDDEDDEEEDGEEEEDDFDEVDAKFEEFDDDLTGFDDDDDDF